MSLSRSVSSLGIFKTMRNSPTRTTRGSSRSTLDQCDTRRSIFSGRRWKQSQTWSRTGLRTKNQITQKQSQSWYRKRNLFANNLIQQSSRKMMTNKIYNSFRRLQRKNREHEKCHTVKNTGNNPKTINTCPASKYRLKNSHVSIWKMTRFGSRLTWRVIWTRGCSRT